jgi:hypothetical protein
MASSQRIPTNPFKLIFQQAEPPTLYNLNDCGNITNGLAGFPTPDVSRAHIVQLHANTTLPSNLPSNLGVSKCVVSRVYLDFDVSSGITTEYDRFTTRLETSYFESQDRWENASRGMNRNQQIAVISCDAGLDMDPIPMMPADTNFSFIFDAAMGLSLGVLQCYPGYCFVKINAPTCLKPWISKQIGAIPGTESNRFKCMNKKVSIGNIGIHNMIMSIDEFVENQTIQETHLIMGLDVNKFSGYFVTTCINTQNTACSAEDAHYYGSKLMTTLKMITSRPDVFVEFVRVTPDAAKPAVFFVHFNHFEYTHGADDMLHAYMNEFRACPKFTMSTGDDRFFYEDNVVYDIGCIACPINTYYVELRTPPVVTESTKKMFLRGFSRGMSSDGTTTTNYAASSNEFPVGKWEHLHSEAVVEIGTTLILQVAEAATSTLVIDRVECENKSVPYVRTATTQISFKVDMQYSGKLIVVYVNDPNLRGGNTENFEWKTTHVFIMPRNSELTGKCIQCPSGLFSGAYAATDISVCLPIKHPTTPLRRLLSVAEVSKNTTEATSWIQIHGHILIVLGIANDAMYADSDFSLEIYLQYNNLTFVQENVALVASKVLQIYNVNNLTMQYNVTRMRLHATNASVIFNIHGMYTNPVIPAQQTPPPTQFIPPENNHVEASKKAESFSLFGINAWILIISAAVFLLLIFGIGLVCIIKNCAPRARHKKTNITTVTEAAYYSECPCRNQA